MIEFKIDAVEADESKLNRSQLRLMNYLDTLPNGELYTRRNLTNRGLLSYAAFSLLPKKIFDSRRSYIKGRRSLGVYYGNPDTIKAYKKQYEELEASD